MTAHRKRHILRMREHSRILEARKTKPPATNNPATGQSRQGQSLGATSQMSCRKTKG